MDLQTEWRPSAFRWKAVVVRPANGLCHCLGSMTQVQAHFDLCRCAFHKRFGHAVPIRVYA